MIAVKPLTLKPVLNYFEVEATEFFPGVFVRPLKKYDPSVKSFVSTGEWEWTTYEQQQGNTVMDFRGFVSSDEAIFHLQNHYSLWVLNQLI